VIADTLSSKVVKVILGDQQQTFHIHVNILRNSGSPPLAALVDPEKWKEGQDGIVDWTDCQSQVGLTIIQFLYLKHYDETFHHDFQLIGTKGFEGSGEHVYNELLHAVKVWIFADKYLLEDVQTGVTKGMDKSLVWLAEKDKSYFSKIVKFIYSNTFASETPNTLQKVVVKALALYIQNQKASSNSTVLHDILQEFPSLGSQICLKMETMSRKRKRSVWG